MNLMEIDLSAALIALLGEFPSHHRTLRLQNEPS
jgi:hypothetical protein